MITKEACTQLYEILDKAKSEYPSYTFMFYNDGANGICYLLYVDKTDKWAVNEELEDKLLGDYFELNLNGEYSTLISISHDDFEQVKEGVEIVDKVITVKEEFYSR